MKKVLVVCLALLMVFTLSVPDIEADAAVKPGLGLACTVYVTLNTGVASIGVCVGTTYNESTATIFTSSGTYPGMANVTLCWKATPKPGYTMSVTSSTFTLNALRYNEIAPSATVSSGTTYTLTVKVPTGVASVRVTYGSSVKTFTTAGTLNVASGTSVSWTATAATGYNLTTGSGSFTMTSARTITPVAKAKSFTVTATLSPSGATADLTWTLEWASGKALTGAVTDYVTMTVASDGKSVTLTFKKAFTSGQMILTCYVTNNPSVKATCTVTCS